MPPLYPSRSPLNSSVWDVNFSDGNTMGLNWNLKTHVFLINKKQNSKIFMSGAFICNQQWLWMRIKYSMSKWSTYSYPHTICSYDCALQLSLRYKLADRDAVDQLHREANLQSIEQRCELQLLKLSYDYSKGLDHVKPIQRLMRAANKIMFKLPTKCSEKYLNSPL